MLVQIAIVSQEPVLFAESILYNICFGMPAGETVTQEQACPALAHCTSSHMCLCDMRNRAESIFAASLTAQTAKLIS